MNGSQSARSALRFVRLARPLALTLIMLVATPDILQSQPYARPVDRTAWYREAKFGMFIHWGPYSIAGVEASWPIMVPDGRRQWGKIISEQEYVQLYKRFNPVKFDPFEWIELAREAGMRYMVFTTRHHDGFCMFDSAYTDYKITNTPYGKDIFRQLAEACRMRNMPLGIYYSPPDMHHPAFRDTSKPARENWHGEPTRPQWPLYLDYMELQLRELLTRYGPIAIVWFDGLRNQEKYDGWRFVKLVRELQPMALINDRIGVPGDYVTPEQWIPPAIPTKYTRIRGGTDASQLKPSTRVPPLRDFQLWETCMTINETWAYNPRDRNFKSARYLVRALVEVASRGGNFLLNVGPTPEGTIQPEFQERLRAIGQWLKVNGEAIYETTYGPLQGLDFARTTAKGNTVYLHVFEWPQNRKIELQGLPASATSVRLLATGESLDFDQTDGRLIIRVPGKAPDPDVSVLAIELDKPVYPEFDL